jgi:UTP-glucose-1-phosphate uridylyltransferase
MIGLNYAELIKRSDGTMHDITLIKQYLEALISLQQKQNELMEKQTQVLRNLLGRKN